MTDLYKSYEALILAGKIEHDMAQNAVVQRLAGLLTDINDYVKPSFLRLFKAKEPPKGFYIYGEVGRGKTFLMDLFYANLNIKHKKRTHFHEFMNEFHEKMFTFRQREKEGKVKGEPISFVMNELIATTKVICFDEFSVVDIADAMIIGRLFQKFFECGVVVVATSNVIPENLYKNGLNRALFIPFITILKEKLEVFELKSRTDYRLEKLGTSEMWLNKRSDMDALFLKLTGETKGLPLDLPHKGRVIHVSQVAFGAARMSFSDLCEKPLAASDYLQLATHFHTVFIDDIPRIEAKNRDHAKRFINLIDALYDNKVKLVASSMFDVFTLYEGSDGFEGFEFARTQSRLIEMRSEDYLKQPHGRADKLTDNTTGLVET